MIGGSGEYVVKEKSCVNVYVSKIKRSDEKIPIERERRGDKK